MHWYKIGKAGLALAALSLGLALCPTTGRTDDMADAAKTDAPKADAPKADASPAAPADPNVAPSLPRFKPTEGNFQATAMIGAFYLTMHRATSYRGRLLMTKTITKPGEPIEHKTVEWNSVWVGNGAGSTTNCLARATFTGVTGEGTVATTIKGSTVQFYNGKTEIRFNPGKNVWSEEPLDDDNTDMSVILANTAWSLILFAFDMGDEFTLNTQKGVVGAGRTVAKDRSGRVEFGIDNPTGRLLYWRMDNGQGEVSEIRWLDTVLNAPIPATEFKWSPPASARKVTAEENKREFVF